MAQISWSFGDATTLLNCGIPECNFFKFLGNGSKNEKITDYTAIIRLLRKSAASKVANLRIKHFPLLIFTVLAKYCCNSKMLPFIFLKNSSFVLYLEQSKFSIAKIKVFTLTSDINFGLKQVIFIPLVIGEKINIVLTFRQ